MLFRSSSEPTDKTQWRPLSQVEKRALTRLLSVEFPGRKELLEQVKGAQAKTLDTEGSILLLPREDSLIAQVVGRIPVEAEFEDSDGVTVHVLLHVIEGLLNELEVYRDDLAPLTGGLRPNDFRLIVL